MAKEPAQSVHKGHRDRMRERIASNGILSLQPHELLEYLLYPFIPRRDTNEIAHKLLDHFGSLSGVMNADADHLMQISGVTRNAAMYLTCFPEVIRYYIADLSSGRTDFGDRGSVRDYLANMFAGARIEQVYAAALDKNDRIMCCERLFSGYTDTVTVSVRKIVDFALKTNAVGLVLAHNHPSGGVQPSAEDVDVTSNLLFTLQSLNVKLYDHLIFSGDSYYSFEESGRLRSISNTGNSLREGINFYEGNY